ncbi:hypothetical protein COOONC_07321 [Cooperia oncophora]
MSFGYYLGSVVKKVKSQKENMVLVEVKNEPDHGDTHLISSRWAAAAIASFFDPPGILHVFGFLCMILLFEWCASK